MFISVNNSAFDLMHAELLTENRESAKLTEILHNGHETDVSLAWMTFG